MSAIFAGAFAFGIGFDVGVTAFYDRWNKGVRSYIYICFHALLNHETRNNGKTFVIDMSKSRCAASKTTINL